MLKNSNYYLPKVTHVWCTLPIFGLDRLCGVSCAPAPTSVSQLDAFSSALSSFSTTIASPEQFERLGEVIDGTPEVQMCVCTLEQNPSGVTILKCAKLRTTAPK